VIAAQPAPSPPVPLVQRRLSQLRPPVAEFTGRSPELASLVAVLAPARGPAQVALMRGQPGSGKRELAYAAAAALEGAYPAAQIVVDLQGLHPEPLSAERAVQTVIQTCAPGATLPTALPELVAFYHQLLAGQRVLILALDAATAAQVTPLVPPPGSALLVTGRPGLTLAGATPHDLGPLPDADAVRLVQQFSPSQDAAAPGLVARCAGLPLALRVGAALLAESPPDPAAPFPSLPATAPAPQGAVAAAADGPAAIQAALARSYATLPASVQQGLAQLSVFPAPFPPVAAQMVLAGPPDQEPAAITALLDTLQRRALLGYDPGRDRYELHPLVHAWAAAHLDAPATAAARARHAAYYATVADEADTRAASDLVAGLVLFDQERAHIDSGWAWARAQPPDSAANDRLVVRYAEATAMLGDHRYAPRTNYIPLLQAAIAAAHRLGEGAAAGRLLGHLGTAYTAMDDLPAAQRCLHEWRDLARAHRDPLSEGAALGNLGEVYLRQGDAAAAQATYEQVLALMQTLGNPTGEAMALARLGQICAQQGQFLPAQDYYEQALHCAQAHAAEATAAAISWDLGLLLAQQGQFQEAAARMQVRVDWERATGQPEAPAHAAQVATIRQQGQPRRRPRQRRWPWPQD